VAPIPLPLGSYQLPAPAASCRRLVNCYSQEAPPEKPKGEPAILCRAPGIAEFADTEEMEVRGGIVMGDTAFFVAGASLYSLSDGGVLTELSGDAISGNGPVRMATNGTDIVICPGDGSGFSSDGSTVSAITDPVFTEAGGVDPVFLDGYIVFRRPGTAQFFNTGLNAITFSGLDVASVEGAPGNLIGLTVNNRELVLAKEASSELWYNAANSPGSPFSRSPNGFKEPPGCAASMSLVNQDNAPVMLASDRTIRRLASVWERVSHHGIESILERMSLLSDCYAMPYTQEGHSFVAFTFPNAGRTLVLDFNTLEWHERESRIDTVSIGRWRPSCILHAYGRQLVGDSQSGKIGILDPDTHTEFGEPQVVRWTYQAVRGDRNRVSHRRLEIGITAGQGLSSGQGENPLLTLFVSDDSGNTFRARPVRSLGRIGQYRRRVQYWNLGSARERVYSCEMSDPVRLFVLDTQLEAEGGRL
jgi:hypothetical protein